MTAEAGSWKMSLARQASEHEVGNLTSCIAPNFDDCNIACDAKIHFALMQIMRTLR
jgi:hypothetical protein